MEKKQKIFTIIVVTISILFLIICIICGFLYYFADYQIDSLLIIPFGVVTLALIIIWSSIAITIKPEEFLITSFMIKKEKQKLLIKSFKKFMKNNNYYYFETIKTKNYKTLIYRNIKISERYNKYVLLFLYNNNALSFSNIRNELIKNNKIVGITYYVFINDTDSNMIDYFKYNEYDAQRKRRFLIFFYNKKEGVLSVSKLTKPLLFQPLFNQELLRKIVSELGFENESNVIVKF